MNTNRYQKKFPRTLALTVDLKDAPGECAHSFLLSSRLMWKLSARLAGRYASQRNMALTNFSQDENQKTVFELSCSAEFVRSLDGEFIFLSAVNIFLSIAAFLGNTLILVALHKETSLHPPSKLLYRNLAITDLCVGIIVEPVAVTYWISVVNERWDICYYAYWAASFSSYSLCSVSLLTLTAMSVDRLAGAQIQTSCNFEKITYHCNWVLDCSVISSSLFFNLLIIRGRSNT